MRPDQLSHMKPVGLNGPAMSNAVEVLRLTLEAADYLVSEPHNQFYTDQLRHRLSANNASEALARLERLVEAERRLQDLEFAAYDHPERYLALKEVAAALAAVLGEEG